MDALRIHWPVGPYHLLNYGNAAGYGHAITRTREALAAYVEYDEGAPLDFQFRAPMSYEPTPGASRRVLFTMFESPDMPTACIDRVRKADVLIVPSRFCQRIFRQYTPAPIYVCPLGHDPVPYRARTIGTPFRWLWVGANNLRKGFQTIAAAWDILVRAGLRNAELYLKTTPLGRSHEGKRERYDSLIFDSRNITREALDRLYDSAHAFAYPTLGEGFGLTLLEAMSAGLPAVATEYGGHLDFTTPRTTRYLPYKLKRMAPGEGAHSGAPDQRYEFAAVNPETLAAAMLDVMADYPAAVAMAERAAKHVASFTWDACARRLATILRHEARRAERKAA